jgi:uncharacterized protein YxeA
MKKLLVGIFAVVLAIGAVAFTTDKSPKFVDYYFPTNSSGVAQTTTTLYTSDQWGCTDGNAYCAKAYSSYTFSSPNYSASGTLNATFFKP